MASTFAALAAIPRPSAKLPDEVVMTPRWRSAGVSASRRLLAPRILKEPVRCADSIFIHTCAPRNSLILSEYSSGVLNTLPAMRLCATNTSCKFTSIMRMFPIHA